MMFMNDLPHTVDHLLCHYARIDVLLQKLIMRNRAEGDDENKYPGLILSDREIDRLFIPADTISHHKLSDEMQRRMEWVVATIEEKQRSASSEGKSLRLDTVETFFGLDTLERDILLLALAPEVNQKYEKIFGYLQDDITKKQPCIFLALMLFLPSVNERLYARTLFESSSPLIRHKLIELKTDPSRLDTPFPALFLTVNKRISGFLLGSNDIDPLVGKAVTRIAPKAQLHELILPSKVSDELDTLSKKFEASKVLYLQGGRGTGKKTIGEALCNRWQRNLLLLEQLPDTTQDFELFSQLICREAVLSNAVIAIQNITTTGNEIEKHLHYVFSWAQQYHITLILCGENKWEPGNKLSTEDFICIQIPTPSSDERRLIWNSRLNGNAPPDRDKLLRQIAATFKINGSQISNAVSTAVRNAYNRDSEKIIVTEQDLFAACQVHSSPLLSKHARKVATRYHWDDIILPEEKIEHLKDLCSSTRYQSVVFNEWGYDAKLSLGKGTQALFAGPSGTGKTMAAEIIASELGLELYKIDLSSVVSKYIGETEKNLSQIFDEAESCNVILFFDEADALMGKRSEVKDAHDRYANIEISYLLQRMEEFNGMSLLATNLRKNIDEAFIRRLRYIVEFPFPDPIYRKKIWTRIWPPRAPLSAEIDFDFLSHQFELSGGNIRNIALNASFIAAKRNGAITMAHILSSVKREFQKMGKVFLNENFGQYRDLLIKIQDRVETV